MRAFRARDFVGHDSHTIPTLCLITPTTILVPPIQAFLYIFILWREHSFLEWIMLCMGGIDCCGSYLQKVYMAGQDILHAHKTTSLAKVANNVLRVLPPRNIDASDIKIVARVHWWHMNEPSLENQSSTNRSNIAWWGPMTISSTSRMFECSLERTSLGILAKQQSSC